MDAISTESEGEKRRAIANYYSHGIHQKICKFDKCYTPTEFCECKLCDDSASSFDHILEDCPYLNDTRPIERLTSILHLNS